MQDICRSGFHRFRGAFSEVCREYFRNRVKPSKRTKYSVFLSLSKLPITHLFRGDPKVALQWQQERGLGVSKDSLLHLLFLAWLARIECSAPLLSSRTACSCRISSSCRPAVGLVKRLRVRASSLSSSLTKDSNSSQASSSSLLPSHFRLVTLLVSWN